MEFSNLLAPPLIEVYNLLEVNLLLHKYLPKVLLRQKPRDRTDHNPVFYNNAIITDITYVHTRIWSNRCHETILYPKLFPYISELVVVTLIVEF